MSERPSREQIEHDLRERMAQAIENYAREHGLSKKEVEDAANSLLLTPTKTD